MTHELSLLSDLMGKICAVSAENGHKPVVGVTLKLGALTPISPDHLREHFEQAARHTVAAAARLTIKPSSDLNDPQAQDIRLLEVELAE
jgi:hydrogenase nickel incorporation protein HypA/HybF